MIFFTLLSLFFGLVTSFSYLTLSINAVIFGLLAHAQASSLRLGKKTRLWLVLALGYVALFGWQTDGLKAITGLTIFSGSFWVSHWLKWSRKVLVRIVLASLCLGLGGVALVDGVQLRNQLAQKISPPFMTDMFVYLNTVRDYKQTGNYYQAFAHSLQGLSPNYGTGQLAGEIWGWKQPLIFTVWRLLPGNTTAIQWLGVIVFSLVLLASYKLARVFVPPHQALIAPFLVWPYFRYPLTEMTLLQVEWWALVVFILGFMAYLHRRFWLAGIAFAFSLAIRELFALPILGLVALQLLQRRLRAAFVISLPTILIFLPYYYFYHLGHVLNYEAFDLLSPATLRQGAQNGWQFVQTTLAYGSWSYGLWMARPFLLLLAANTIGIALLLIVKQKQRGELLSLSVSFLLFFLLSFKLGIMDVWHDYWGIYYVPLLLTSTPIVFYFLDKEVPEILRALKKRASI